MNQAQGKVQVYIVCGVSGCGKTTIAERLCAKYFDCSFIEGDDLHPIENKAMMSRGEPLDDAHRSPWLKRIAEAIRRKSVELQTNRKQDGKLFVTCSALKRIYREEIVRNLTSTETVIWVYLKIDDKERLKDRIRTRTGHFMNANLVQSQFDALEEPTGANVIQLSVEGKSIEQTVDELFDAMRTFR